MLITNLDAKTLHHITVLNKKCSDHFSNMCLNNVHYLVQGSTIFQN